MQVSIIIINYNTLKMTRDCIDSVFAKTNGVEFEVILVDNASTDGSKEYFEKDNRIIYIYSEENLGFGRANNLGYKYTKGNYIFLLNSDTLLVNNAVYEFWIYMEQTESKIGCLGCQLFNADMVPIHSAGKFPQVPQFGERIIHFLFSEFYKNRLITDQPFKQDTDVDYITGADLFIRRAVIEQCGLFDSDFFMYFEETEMQFRYSQKGFVRRIILSPRIIHLVGGSNKKVEHSLKGIIMEMKSRYVYSQKTLNHMQKKVIAFMHILMIPRIALCRASVKEKKELITIILINLF